MLFRLLLLLLAFTRDPRAELMHIARKHIKAVDRGLPL